MLRQNIFPSILSWHSDVKTLNQRSPVGKLTQDSTGRGWGEGGAGPHWIADGSGHGEWVRINGIYHRAQNSAFLPRFALPVHKNSIPLGTY